MSETRNKRLAGWLREGDPARHDPALTDGERTAMRARILQSPAPSTAPLRTLAPGFAVAAAASLLLVMVLLFSSPRSARPTGAVTVVASETSASLTRSGGDSRHIEFVAPGGTRIIWKLDAAFDGQVEQE